MKIAVTLICLLAGGCHLVLPLSPATDQHASADTLDSWSKESIGPRPDMDILEIGVGPVDMEPPVCPLVPPSYDGGVLSAGWSTDPGNPNVVINVGTATFSGLGSVYNNSPLTVGPCGLSVSIDCSGKGTFEIILYKQACSSMVTCVSATAAGYSVTAKLGGTPAMTVFGAAALAGHTFNTVELRRSMGTGSVQIWSLKMTTVSP